MTKAEENERMVMVSVRLNESMIRFLDEEAERKSKEGAVCDRSKIVRHVLDVYRARKERR